MGQILTFKKMKDSGQPHPASEALKRYSENILTPVTLSGVVAPWTNSRNGGQASEYMLVSYSGLEYFIVADEEWREVLSTYCWEEVKVIGLLNVAKRTLIPQKVYPKGPTGVTVIDWVSWKSKDFAQKFVKSVNDLVVIPAAAVP